IAPRRNFCTKKGRITVSIARTFHGMRVGMPSIAQFITMAKCLRICPDVQLPRTLISLALANRSTSARISSRESKRKVLRPATLAVSMADDMAKALAALRIAIASFERFYARAKAGPEDGIIAAHRSLVAYRN